MMRSAKDREIFQSMRADQRRAQRRELALHEVTVLEEYAAQDRAEYLVTEALGQEEVWAPFEDNFLTGWEDGKTGYVLTPIWPHVEFAKSFKMSRQHDWQPVPIPIVDWIDVVTPDLVSQGRRVALFPVNGNDFLIADPVALVDEWEVRWKSFAKHYFAYGRG